jgi:uncharacterized protein YgiM (DUF1202 family)
LKEECVNHRRVALLLVVFALITGAVAAAPAPQVVNQPTTDPNAVISFPPPVYVLRGRVEIRGTANIEGMLNHFLEFRRLNENLTVDESAEWIPATLPNRNPVINNIVGVWDTTTTEDGLYELRLTVNIPRAQARFFLVSPLRVENRDLPFVTPQNPNPRATPTPFVRPTLRATPTAFTGAPTVTAVTDANVRSGDAVAYPVVGSLLAGQSAQIIGISSNNGWYYIQLSTGRRGFISPSVVNVVGDVSDLQVIVPPATPTPTFTPTPPFTGDLIINGHATVPDRPRCNSQFDVQLNVSNIGSSTTASTFVVRIEDVDIQTGQVTASGANTVPLLMAPGQNYVVVIPITVSAFPGRDHRITATVDVNNQVVEENETNNQYSFTYRLRQGDCP